jgi:hypothetical protein
MRPIRFALLAALALLSTFAPAAPAASAEPAAPAAPAAPRSVEGTWKGRILNLRVVVHIAAASDGSLSGSLDSPDQGATGLVANSVALTGDTLRIDLSSIGARFAGVLTADGNTVSGTWYQGGAVVPVALRRSSGEGDAEARKPQEPAPPFPYRAEEVSFVNPRGKNRIAGTLTIPEGKGPFPGVLLLTGSGAQDRDETVFGHRPFLVLADYLTRRGVAVLRVDDRGVGGSEGSHARSTLLDLSDDAVSGIAYLRARNEVDRARIGLLGHSQGGLVGSIAAVRMSDAVSFLVLLASVGMPGDELLQRQSAMVAKQQGAGAAQIERQDEIQARIYSALKEPGDSAAVAERVRPLVAELLQYIPEDQANAMGGREVTIDRQLLALLSPSFRSLLVHDPRPVLRQVRSPVLALNGEKDVQVPAKESLAGIEKALLEGRNKDVTVRTMPGLNHLFQTCENGSIAEYASIEETMSPVVLETIGDWIAARTGGGAAKAAAKPAGKR